MKVRINKKEIDKMKICGILSFLFDQTIKKCSYNINSNKQFEIERKKPLEKQKMNIATNTLNEKIKKLQKKEKFSPFL